MMNRILIVDDDPDFRRVMELLLQKNGYEVASASRKEEALEKIASFKPAVIFLDVLLSGNDGRQICKDLKADPKTSDIRIIMSSAHPSAGDRYAEYGADAYLSKPFNGAQIMDVLKSTLASA